MHKYAVQYIAFNGDVCYLNEADEVTHTDNPKLFADVNDCFKALLDRAELCAISPREYSIVEFES